MRILGLVSQMGMKLNTNPRLTETPSCMVLKLICMLLDCEHPVDELDWIFDDPVCWDWESDLSVALLDSI